VIRLTIALLAGLAPLWPQVLAAQSPAQTDNPVQVGDHWTIDTKDELTGSPTDTFIRLVTEVSPNEVVVRSSVRGKSGFSLIVFDHSWNRIEDPQTKWKPNDGQGIQMPLVIGRRWRTELESRNVQQGGAWKGTVVSNVTGQEKIMTAAGMFDAFRIEEKVRDVNSADPSRYQELESVNWYAPQVNFWVRRIITTFSQKRVSSKISAELVDFGRKL
jgi:hypothetical protein